MNTKTFAQQARKILMQGVANKLRYWGFDEKGKTQDEPQLIDGGYIFRDNVFEDEGVPVLWQSLKNAVIKNGIDQIIEEAAYTWFNRLMSIQILAKNGYELSQLEYAEGLEHTPLMLQRARQGQYSFLNNGEQARLKKILTDYTKDQNAFAILIVAYCHSHTLLKSVFGGMDDYTEILLPDNTLADNGFLYLLNTSDAISDDDYKQVELIGWLYQFYISDKKDEVFASFKQNKKAEAKDIPAATQIFTPNWIVKYMVQNTVGKLWLDLHPDSPVREEMKYLVENGEEEKGRKGESEKGRGGEGENGRKGEMGRMGNREKGRSERGLIIKEVKDLKLLDPASGSGHILVEGFDLLYKMYMEEFYTREEAVESILKYNLFGLDIDKRASQLAKFAVLLKAAKQFPDVLKKGWMPHVYAMPAPYDFSRQDLLDFLGVEGAVIEPVLGKALLLMQDSQNLGSVMQFDLNAWDFHNELVQDFLLEKEAIRLEFFEKSFQLFREAAHLADDIRIEWGGNDFTKATITKALKTKHPGFEGMIEKGKTIYQQADKLGYILSSYSNMYDTAEVLGLLERSDKEQLELINKVKKTMAEVTTFIAAIASQYPMVDFKNKDAIACLSSKNAVQQKLCKDTLQFLKYPSALRAYLNLNLGKYTFDYIKNRLQTLQTSEKLTSYEQAVLPHIAPYLEILILLCQKYEAVVANPPYMGQGNMNDTLKEYINNHYLDSKSDLMTVFMEKALDLLLLHGQLGMINLPSWMFLSSFEELRQKILKNNFFTSLIQFGRGVFGSDFGSVCFCISKEMSNGRKGIYRRLFQEHVKVDSVEIKEERFLDKSYGYFTADQTNFSKIPGSPIAYWVSERVLETFGWPILSEILITREGMATADNERFLKYWNELSFKKITLNCPSEEASCKLEKWFPYNKGGPFRKWYGNNEFCIEYENQGYNIKNNRDPKTGRIRSHNYNGEFSFKEGITWSALSSGNISVRFSFEGYLFDSKGAKGFSKNNQEILALLNSNLAIQYLKILSPTIDYKVGDIIQIPYSDKILSSQIRKISITNIAISKSDWDSRETSWDFQQSPLLNESASLREAYQKWRENVTNDFFQLHANEEELNRIFIDIYGLQDELTPDVALKDITILQDELVWGGEREEEMGRKGDGEIGRKGDGEMGRKGERERGRKGEGVKGREESVECYRKYMEDKKINNSIQITDYLQLPIKRQVVMQQLVSYAIGVFMGRYHLDKPGLHIAHPNPAKEETTSYTFNNQTVEIDQDAIVPLMGTACDFADDAIHRFKGFLDIIWGGETRIDNINFLQECLDQDLEKFMVKDFWKVHCSMYKKKPVYWLFSSAKGAFQVLVYMHRMNAFTVEKIRANYLMPHLKGLRSKIAALEKNASSLSALDAKQLDKLRKDLSECEQYDMVLKDKADQQITFDLDNGVTENYKLFKGVVAEVK